MCQYEEEHEGIGKKSAKRKIFWTFNEKVPQLSEEKLVMIPKIIVDKLILTKSRGKFKEKGN
jgi:hypothetical protein